MLSLGRSHLIATGAPGFTDELVEFVSACRSATYVRLPRLILKDPKARFCPTALPPNPQRPSDLMTAQNNRERILPRLIHEEIKESFINYSMSVIVSRALPDVRDGLKPVHRRVLYSMFENNLVPGRPYKKCATVVGDVLGKYHPHGDSSVYDALVRMVQDFSLRYPLVDGQGNFGSVDGDAAAAYRYTEAKLTRIATELLSDIDKETVDFIPNFDDREQEPTVLPAGIPN